jgi:hypothetical protein
MKSPLSVVWIKYSMESKKIQEEIIKYKMKEKEWDRPIFIFSKENRS